VRDLENVIATLFGHKDATPFINDIREAKTKLVQSYAAQGVVDSDSDEGN
jgi:hypothetical protein